MVRFIDRIDEMALLENDWDSQDNAFIVVFGRRRIGKSTLIAKFLENKEGLSYVADDTSKKIQITELKNAFANFLNDDFLLKQEIADWSSLFEYLSKTLDKKKRIFIWLDEFSYLIKNDPSILSVFQKFIDSFIRSSKIFIIVSGSLFGLMSEQVLSNSSPLYGRRSRDILLKQIPLSFINQFLDTNFEDMLKVYFTISGIPEYLNVASRYKSYDEFIMKEFFTQEGYFYREPNYLLSQEFKEIKTYFSIINAIAYGNSKPSDIANFVGINAREIYPYLELLISYGFIKRETSMLGDNKRGVYQISDNFFDFWFNFTHKNRESIERRKPLIDKNGLSKYFGKRFEIMMREILLNHLSAYNQIGRWWHKEREIDIVALNDDTKEILFAECKWQDKVDAEKLLIELKEKAKYVDWNTDKRKDNYAIFAKSFKTKKINGVMLYDLKDLEKILKNK